MTEREHDPGRRGDEEGEERVDEAGRGGGDDAGLIGGGGPASTTEPEDPKDTPARRPDTEH